MKKIWFLFVFVGVFISGCEKDEFDQLKNPETKELVFENVEVLDSEALQIQVSSLLKENDSLSLDWSQKREVDDPVQGGAILVPVTNSQDYILFYLENGSVFFKYLFRIEGQSSELVFEETSYQVLNQRLDLSFLAEELLNINKKEVLLELRKVFPKEPSPLCDGPRCPSFGSSWFIYVYKSFTRWLEDLFTKKRDSWGYSPSDGRNNFNSDSYFSSNGPSDYRIFSSYKDIPNGQIGINFKNGYGSTYNNKGEIYNSTRSRLITMLPYFPNSLSYVNFFEDHPEVLTKVDFYFEIHHYSSESKQAVSSYVQLMMSDWRFSSENINIIDFQPEELIAGIEFYKILVNENYLPKNAEEFEFLLEMFQNHLLPLGISFIPYGIGDAVDIFESCNSYRWSWSCSMAILGVLVPFDELADVFRKATKLKRPGKRW